MQKAYNIVSVLVILGLAIWIFFLIRANAQWKELLTKSVITANPQNADTTQSSTEKQISTDTQKNVTMGEMWDSLQQKIGQVKIELDLK